MTKVLKITEEQLSRVEFIQTIHVDINGLARGKMFPVTKLSDLLEDKEEILSEVNVLGTKSEFPSSIKELSNGVRNSNIVLDKGTLQIAPWCEDDSLAIVFYDLYEITTFKPCNFNPRLLAKSKLKELEDLGYKLLISAENEFRVFNKSTLKPIDNSGVQSGQFVACTVGLPFVKQLNKRLKRIDIEMESWDMRVGLGQIGISLKAYMDIQGLDNIWLFRELTKYVANDMDLTVSYMTSPLDKNGSNGLHINHSLLRKIDLKTEMKSDENRGKLSEVGKCWLAGLIKHSRALTAIMCPTVNCYRRIKEFSSIPTKISWDYMTRDVSYRVNIGSNSSDHYYIEDIVPSSSCNIYLAVAAMIVAGLDGIQKELHINDAGNGDHCESFPKSLDEALNALEKDEALRKGLGEKFVDWYIKVKRESDINVLKDVDIKKDSEEDLKRERNKYFDI